VLGVGAVRGRSFLPDDDSPSANPVVLVSDNFWERRFARDPDLLGRHLTLDGAEVIVVGITPRDFSGTSPTVPDFWVPLVTMSRVVRNLDLLHDRSSTHRIYGRLRPSITARQAEAEMGALDATLQLSFPGTAGQANRRTDRFRVQQASLAGEGGSLAQMSLVLGELQGAIGLVLLIACANVAGLLLARSAARHKEIATRLAIGASRRRVVQQLLTESAVLSLLASVLGILLSWWLLRYIVVQMAPSMLGTLALLNVAPDQRVLAYTLCLSMGTAVAFGLAPALAASKPSLIVALKDGAASGGHVRQSRLRDLMVGTQVAVCLLLLIAMGLLTRASSRAFNADMGFNDRGVVALNVDYPRAMLPAMVTARRSQLVRQLEGRPEIQSVAVADSAPLVWGLKVIGVAPRGGAPGDPDMPYAHFNQVTSNYFDTLGIPILRGRTFTTQELRDDANFDGSSVIVSDTTARRLWPGQEAVGKPLAFGACRGCRILPAGDEYPHSTSSVVIGVAKDVRSQRLDSADDLLLYLPATGAISGMFVIRVRGDEAQAATAIRRALHETQSNLEATVWDSRTTITKQSGFVAARVGAIAAAIIGGLGLLMASVGIYGAVSFAVTQRTHEIGIRMALGARRGNVLALLVSDTMRPVAIGMVVGLTGAVIVSFLMSSLLFGLSPLDPLTFLGVLSFLAAVALLAGYVPARRATKVDPLIALRYE
jgi:predicted permease